jgi:hypothetical protein
LGAGVLEETTLFDAVVKRLSELPDKRRVEFIKMVHEQIRKTPSGTAIPGQIPMSALARRIYLIGQIMDDSKAESPQHLEIQTELDSFRSEIGESGFEPLVNHDKLVENFARHKTAKRGTKFDGFYCLVALYICREEYRVRFDPQKYLARIPASEVKLGQEIGVYFARGLNDEASRHGEKEKPFPQIKPQNLESSLHSVGFTYLQKAELEERTEAFVERHRTPQLDDSTAADDNAHLILYRNRYNSSTDLIKSFLVIKPLHESAGSSKSRYHPTFHIYKAPTEKGGKEWSSAGKVVSLDSGLYVIGGQHRDVLDKRGGNVNKAPVPFRAMDIIYFPWETLDTSPLFSGLMLSVNKDGEALAGRICARPTILQNIDEARIGSMGLSDLEADLIKDQAAESEFAANLAEQDFSHILDIYGQYGSIENLADIIRENSNNHAGEDWGLGSNLTKDAQTFTDDDYGKHIGTLHSAILKDGKPFAEKRDLRVAPLRPL